MKSTLIPIALLCAGASLARADFNPITLTPGSYNADVVVEKTATAPIGVACNATIDNGTNLANWLPSGDTWMEQGFFTNNPTHGLPAPGVPFVALSNSAISFAMAPSYTANNAIMIDATMTNGTWIPVTPAAYSSLSFLSSGGNGGRMINVTAYHQDGTTSTGSFSSPDWFFVTEGVAWISNGRIWASSYNEDNAGSNNPRLYYRQVAIANTTSPITNITLTLGTGGGTGHVGVMAVSGSTDGVNYAPIAVTGYNVDVVVEKTASQPNVAMRDFTTASMDGGTNNNGNTWYERGYQPFLLTSGLPAAGSTITSLDKADHHYQMPASYAANNCIYVDSNNPVANVTFASPAAYSALSFLSAAANGAVTNQCIMQYADGSQETNLFVSKDWFNNSPYAYTSAGRVSLDNRTFNNVGSSNPRLYEAEFVLGNVGSPVTNVIMEWIGGSANSRAVILAVSATAGAISPIIGTSPTNFLTPEGMDAAFSATIAGGTQPFTNQWQFSPDGVTYTDLTDSAQVAGATTTDLYLTGVGITNIGYYRLHVSNVAGSANSVAAFLTVVSSLQDVTQPGDPITVYQGSDNPPNEPVANAIDNTTSKYLNWAYPPNPPCGFVVTPQVGRTRVTVARFYTANDAPERDPADFTLEGSNDGGSHWTLITSNAFTLPDGRNQGGLYPDPLTQPMAQVAFANTQSYTKYRVTFWHTRGNAFMQIGEVELCGEQDTSGTPYFYIEPVAAAVYTGDTVGFTAAAAGDPVPSLRWQKGTNDVYVDLVDDAHIFGSQSGSLTISPVSLADAADYICIASSTSGSATSTVAHLTVISTLTDVTLPTDTVTTFGDQSRGHWGAAGIGTVAFDNSSSVYVNGGSGPSAEAGFSPFAGPVGLVVTPRGSSLVTGLRLYTSDSDVATDPADYKLEGSNDGGTNYTVISSGSLALPATRNAANQALDPLTQSMQEVLFANTQFYTSYRLTFTNVKTNDTANSLRLGDVELLGLAGPTTTVAPAFQNVAVGSPATTIVATATGTGTLSYQWQRNTGSGYGLIAGATTSELALSPATLADSGQYRVVVTDDNAPATSPVAIVNVVSTLKDVTSPSDTVTIVCTNVSAGEGVENAIDNDTDKYLNFGLNNGSPFLGPVGLTVTPAAGPSVVTGLRVYTANDAAERDPADYTLEGSNDGMNFITISTGTLLLPPDRNATGLSPLDPIAMFNWEARFANASLYNTYRLTVTHVRNDSAANSMQLAEIELLGTVLQLTVAANPNGTLTISSTMPGTLWSATVLVDDDPGTEWENEGPISGSVTITPDPGEPAKFYRVSVP